jgi:hypothetical protein
MPVGHPANGGWNAVNPSMEACLGIPASDIHPPSPGWHSMMVFAVDLFMMD